MESTLHPILHVEDQDNDIFLLQRAFVNAGISHPIQPVKNGRHALDYLLGRHPFEGRDRYPTPSLILLDLSMPLMTGLELLRWRQTQAAIKRVPVIVLTASRQSQDVIDAYEFGANGYLVKPVNFEELVEMVKAIRVYWLTHNTFPEPASH